MLKETCASCWQPITNPICESCFIRQVSSWLINIDMTALPKEIIISALKQEISHDTLNEEECIFCGNHVDICSYCFVEKASRIFRRLGLRKEFIQSFQAIFSYNGPDEIES